MRCAVSFLSVLVLVVGVGVAAFFIIWSTKEKDPTCEETHFQCIEDRSCIPNNLRCNNRPDCPNGSDEHHLNCSDLDTDLEEFIMRNINCGAGASNSSFPVIEYPTGCRRSKNRIFCRDTEWQEVPWKSLGLFANATQLLLENVLSIGNLTTELVPPLNNSIKRIIIENNTLGVLEKASICNWDGACKLDLSNNSIEIIAEDAFCDMPNLIFLILSNNKFDLKGFQFRGRLLKDLWLSQNRIEVISEELFRNVGNISILKLDCNRIHTIHERAFVHNVNLTNIDLSQNRLKQFPPLGLIEQKRMTRLNLGHNPFELIPDKVFSTLTLLKHLNVSGVEITALDFRALNNLPKLDFIYFKKFSYCWYVPKVSRCYPSSDGMSSVINLMAGPAVRVMMWIVAILTLGGNLMVLLSRCFLNSRGGKILDVFINNLAGADFLMGVYLLVLAVKDVQYRNSFNEHAYEWSTSLLCSGIGILGMISSEVSLLILTIMSVERYLVISGTFSNRKKLSLNLARVTMTIIWVFATALAVAPAIQWRGKLSFYGSTGLCFPVHLDDPFSIGWQYTAFVFVGLNSTCLIIVALSYSALFCVIRKTIRKSGRLCTPIVEDMEMAMRFFLMVFTNCICWLPIIMLKIYALAGHQIQKEVITWVLIFVLPINSTINPYLYTLSMEELRMNLFRHFMPAVANRNPRRSIINLPTRRHGGESREHWDTTNTTNTTTGEAKAVPNRNRVSYQESIASSNVSYDPN